jgi:hypothetical protein
MSDLLQKLQAFIDDWVDTPEQTKRAFLSLKEYLASKSDTGLNFLAREGITYSLRAMHANQKDRPLFVLVDVIEDQPRWLSVCFYENMITDPEERGVFIPGGILGEDALCFDVVKYNEEELKYIEARMDEAHRAAQG